LACWCVLFLGFLRGGYGIRRRTVWCEPPQDTGHLHFHPPTMGSALLVLPSQAFRLPVVKQGPPCFAPTAINKWHCIQPSHLEVVSIFAKITNSMDKSLKLSKSI
jgi:hypothetical protein